MEEDFPLKVRNFHPHNNHSRSCNECSVFCLCSTALFGDSIFSSFFGGGGGGMLGSEQKEMGLPKFMPGFPV